MACALSLQDNTCRQDDVIYFIGDTSPESWAGTIEDEDDMTDDQIKDYIKSTKPELFQKLRGLRVSSSRIPLTFKPLRDLRRLFGMDTERQDQNLISPQYITSPGRSVASKKPGLPPGGTSESAPCFADPSLNEDPRQDLSKNNPEQNQDQLKLDGVAQKVVLSAAERLYPQIEPAKTAPLSFRDKHVEAAHAFNYLPNSKEAIDIRALKQLEIDETLAEVSKYAKRLEAAKSQLTRLVRRSPSPDASVLITRPFYMEPKADRYKKQGLTPYDKTKQNKAMRPDNSNNTPPSGNDNSLYCYCREPENGREMVRCSKEWCSVGWFHLQCTGLDRLPFLNEEFHCGYCSDELGPLISGDLLDERPHRHPEPTATRIDSVAQHYLDNEIQTEVVYEECADGQRRTNASGKTSIYDEGNDEGDQSVSDATDDRPNAAKKYAKLHDKVVKWRAVNDPYRRGNLHGEAQTPDDNRTADTSSTTSYFNDDSDDSEDGTCPASDSSTIRASSPVIATTKSTTSLKVNKENQAKECYDQDMEMTDSGMTTIDSARDGDDEDEGVAEPSESAYFSRHYVNNRNLTSNSRSTAATQITFPPQPSTITDSTRDRARARDSHTNQSNSLFTFRAGLPSHFPSFDNPTTGPRTPTHAPRVSPCKAKKPWGTPVNVKDYHFDIESVLEPVSPSPDKKRKFGEVDEDEEMVTVMLDDQAD